MTRLFGPEVGAAAFRQRVLAESLARLGCEVEVVTSRPPAAVRVGAGDQHDAPLRVSRWPVLRDENGNVRGYVRYLSFDGPALFRLFARRPPAFFVVEPPPTTGVVVRLVAAVQRRPYVYYAADVWADGAASAGGSSCGGRDRSQSRGRGAPQGQTVLSVSEGVSERVERLGVPRDRIHLVGNGIDTSVFHPDGPDAGMAGPYFAYAGTMSEWQGADVFVEALALVRRDHPTARIVFMGQGSRRAALAELAKSTVPGAVELCGVVQPSVVASTMRGAVAGLVSIRPGLGYDFAKPTKIYAATGSGRRSSSPVRVPGATWSRTRGWGGRRVTTSSPWLPRCRPRSWSLERSSAPTASQSGRRATHHSTRRRQRLPW